MKNISMRNGLTTSFSRGFTFIEMMVAVFLMSLIVGITTIFFANTLPSAKQKAAARDLTATIKYAKNLAYAKNERQIINLDLDAGSYGIQGREARNIESGTAIAVYEENPNADPIRTGKYTISYDSTGASGWDKITLSRGEKVITIKADPVLAAVIAYREKNENYSK